MSTQPTDAEIERVGPDGLYGAVGVAMFKADLCGLRIDQRINFIGNAAYLAMQSARTPTTDAMIEEYEPMLFERPVGNTLDEWRENVRTTDLYQRGDTVLIWVNEGDICYQPFVRRYTRTPPPCAGDDVERVSQDYVRERGGHDGQCCFNRQNYGCNCRASDWREAFIAGYNEAIAALGTTPSIVGQEKLDG